MIAASRQEAAVVGILAVGAAITTMIATRNGPGLTPDSIHYISTGINVAAGRGLRTYDGQLLTVFPPALPLVIAAGVKIGATAELTVRVFNAVVFAGIVVLSHVLARRHLSSRRLIDAVTLLTALSMPLLAVSDRALTEPAFDLVCLAFILTLVRIDRGRRFMKFALAVALVWLGFFLRYAGVTLIASGVVRIAASSWRRWRALAITVAPFAVAAVVAPLAWVLRNRAVDGTLLGPRTPSTDSTIPTVKQFITVLGSFLAPQPIPATIRTLVGIACISAFVVVVYTSMRRRAVDGADGSVVEGVRHDSPEALLVFIAVYSVYIVGAQLSTSIDRLDLRLLSPLFVPTIIVVMCAIEATLPAPTIHRAGPVRRLVAAGLVLIVAVQSVACARQAVAASKGVGYAAPYWRNSELVHATRDLPADARVYSNRPWPIWAITRRWPMLDSPERADATIVAEIEDGTESQSAGCTYLAWFDAFVDYHASPSALENVISVTAVARFGDGTLYRLAPPGGRPRKCLSN